MFSFSFLNTISVTLISICLITPVYSESVEIICSYKSVNWYDNVTLNECGVENDFVVVKRNYEVKSVKIIRKNSKAKLRDIEAIRIEYVVMYFLIKGFGDHLKNITGLSVGCSQMKEITKEDLKAFPKLKTLWIWENDLEALEADLFMYNPDITYVNFYWNFLKFINPDIFSNLKSLQFVYVYKNTCIDSGASNKEELNRLVEEIEKRCKPQENAKLMEKIGNSSKTNRMSRINLLLVSFVLIRIVI